MKRIFRGKNPPVLRIDPQGLAFPARRGFEVEEPEFLAGVVTDGGIFIREEGESPQENGDDFLGLQTRRQNSGKMSGPGRPLINAVFPGMIHG